MSGEAFYSPTSKQHLIILFDLRSTTCRKALILKLWSRQVSPAHKSAKPFIFFMFIHKVSLKPEAKTDEMA